MPAVQSIEYTHLNTEDGWRHDGRMINSTQRQSPRGKWVSHDGKTTRDVFSFDQTFSIDDGYIILADELSELPQCEARWVGSGSRYHAQWSRCENRVTAIGARFCSYHDERKHLSNFLTYDQEPPQVKHRDGTKSNAKRGRGKSSAKCNGIHVDESPCTHFVNVSKTWRVPDPESPTKEIKPLRLGKIHNLCGSCASRLARGQHIPLQTGGHVVL